MNRMVKNLMVVLVAALMFFTSVLTTPVHAESASDEPVETLTEEITEAPAEQPADENAEPQTPVNDEGNPTEAVKPEEAGQEPASEPVSDDAANKNDSGEELEGTNAEVEPADEPAIEETAVEAKAAPAVNGAPALMKAQPARAASNKVPEHSKTLTDNHDGTYTLKLSITGSGESSTTNPKANVIFVMDRSGSMQKIAEMVESDKGYYGYVGDNYVYLYFKYNGYYYSLADYPQYADQVDTVYYISDYSWGTAEYSEYSGQRYNTRRRDQVAIEAATDLVESLLGHNNPTSQATADIVEIAFVSFNNMATNGNNGNWTTNKSTAQTTVAGYTYQDNTGTNWQDALKHAKALADAKRTAQPDEPVYIIFLTDGNPTYYLNGDTRAGTGYEEEPNITNSYNGAAPVARQIIDAGYNLYNIGVFGDVDRMENLTTYANGSTAQGKGTAAYYPASDASALNQAFDEILASITNSLSLANVIFNDGVTGMTSSTGVNGKPGNFKYEITVNGETSTWDDAPAATVNDNVVTWDLSVDKDGKDLIIADGVTVTCSFIVWPSQRAQDLVADLNNGVQTYASLKKEEKAQIVGTGENQDKAPYKLKTNTDFPTLDYSIVQTVQHEGQDPVTEIIPQTQVKIKNPDPVGLSEDKLHAVKSWEDTLDPDQRKEIKDVVLYLKVDGDYYYKDDVTKEPIKLTLTEASNWTETDYISVAPGLLVTSESPAYDPTKPHFTYEGVTYAMLETGHEYVFEESNINNHYELTAYTHHPMIMGTDAEGKPIVKDVTFTKDSTGAITGIESIADMGDSISATNTLKGGINVEKKVVDADGNPFDTNDTFNVTVNVTDAEGNALPTKTTKDGTEYTIDYRIYYGKKNPAYATSGTDHRSGHIYKTGTSFEETIYVGDVIRVVNVENGALFNVEETVDSTKPYKFDKIEYTTAYGKQDAAAFKEKDIVTKAGKTWYRVNGNSSCNATVINKLDAVFYIYHSGVAGDGNLETIPMSECNADMSYNLYAKTTTGKLYGGYYLDYAGKGKYADDGIKSTGGEMYTGMNVEWNTPAQTTPGTKMYPVANETYYIKEVPTYYLRNYYEMIYVKATRELKGLYLISAVDDLHYKETGFLLTKEEANDKKTAKVVSSLTYKSWGTTKSITLKANTVFKKLGITGEGSENDKLTYVDVTSTDYFGVGKFTVLPYWITPDGIEVTGISTRTINIGSMTRNGVTKSDS